jgi:pimeloyl-ACP methyl ester carboxylesterase
MGSIPDWFWAAIETPCDEDVVEVEECDVRWQAWGDPGADRGLLLVHGMFAHAHWWDFIAPRLTEGRRVAALDLTGMGDSDYRHEYDADTWADELRAVADAAGLPADTTVVGHSFGGRIGLHALVRHADRFCGLVLADAGVRDPEDDSGADRPPIGGRPVLYPDRATAENRFRLQPPQPCDNEYLLQYIAKHSVLAIDGGFAFKFDTDLFETVSGVSRDDAEADLRALSKPLALVYGALSESFSERTLAYMRTIAGDFPATALEDAHHHLFLDRPLEFVDALEGLLRELG